MLIRINHVEFAEKIREIQVAQGREVWPFEACEGLYDWLEEADSEQEVNPMDFVLECRMMSSAEIRQNYMEAENLGVIELVDWLNDRTTVYWYGDAGFLIELF